MDTSHRTGESGGTPHKTRGSGGTQDGAGGSRGGSPHRTGVPARCSSPCARCACQVEAVISRHREELLAERYRFNMGLLMGEWGQRGPWALIPSCLVSRPPPGFLCHPAGGVGAPPALGVHPGAAGPGFGTGSPGQTPSPRAPRPCCAPPCRGGAQPAAVGGREEHQERGGSAGGCPSPGAVGPGTARPAWVWGRLRVTGLPSGPGALHGDVFFPRCCICWDQRQKQTWKRNQR